MKTAALVLTISLSVPAWARTAEEVKEKTAEAGKAAVEYTKEQKAAFVSEMENKIDAVKSEIETMKQKTTAATEQKVKDLEDKQKALEEQLTKLKNSSGRAWSKIREGTASAWKQLQQSVSDAKKEMTK